MGPYLTRLPLLLPLIGIIAGVIANMAGAGVTVAIVLIVCGVLAAMLRRAEVDGLLMATAVGWVAMSLNRPVMCQVIPGDYDECVATVESVREINAGQKAIVKSGGVGIELTVPTIMPSILPGDVIRFKGYWDTPEIDIDLPGQVNGRLRAMINGVSLRCFVSRGNLVVVDHENSLGAVMCEWQNRVIDWALDSSLDESAAVFVGATLTGDRTVLTDEMRDSYAAAGVAHILALSGAHVGIIWGVIAILTWPLAMLGCGRLRRILIIAGLWGFALFSGLSPSVVRSTVMATVVIIGYMIGRRHSGLNSLCLAAILILLFDPVALVEAQFQLSFMATLAIIVVTPSLTPLYNYHPTIRVLSAAVIVTVAATVATAPLTAYYFGRLPLGFIAGNLLMVVVMPVMLVGGIIVVVMMAVGIDPVWVCDILNFVSQVADSVIYGIGTQPELIVESGKFDAGWLIPIYLCVISMFVGAIKHKLYLFVGSAVALAGVVVLMAVVKPVYPADRLWVVRNHSGVTVLRQQGVHLDIMSDSPTANIEADSAAWVDRYKGFIEHSEIRTLNVIIMPRLFGDSTRRVSVGGKTMMIIDDSWNRFISDSVDYLLVSRHFRGDVLGPASAIVCDTIVLGTDMSTIRAKRYLRELTEAGYRARLLADRPIIISHSDN